MCSDGSFLFLLMFYYLVIIVVFFFLSSVCSVCFNIQGGDPIITPLMTYVVGVAGGVAYLRSSPDQLLCEGEEAELSCTGQRWDGMGTAHLFIRTHRTRVQQVPAWQSHDLKGMSLYKRTKYRTCYVRHVTTSCDRSTYLN